MLQNGDLGPESGGPMPNDGKKVEKTESKTAGSPELSRAEIARQKYVAQRQNEPKPEPAKDHKSTEEPNANRFAKLAEEKKAKESNKQPPPPESEPTDEESKVEEPVDGRREEKKNKKKSALPAAEPKPKNFLAKAFSKVFKKGDKESGGEEADSDKKKPTLSLPKIDSVPQFVVVLAVVLVILIVGLRFWAPTVMPESVQKVQQGQEVKPRAEPVVPLDLKNADWVAPIQQVLLLEGIAFLLLTAADARRRSQLSDAVAVVIGVVIIFAPVIPMPGGNNLGVYMKFLGFEGTSSVILATVLVVWSSFAGGRDFTPLGCYLGCIGLGGVIFGSLGEVSAMLRLDPTSSAMSVGQIINHFIVKAPGSVALSIWIDLFLIAAFGTLLYEVLRPTAMVPPGDNSPNLGSLLSMSLGVAGYLLGRFGLYQGPPVSFILSLSAALVIGAMTQYEKLPQFIPGKWSVRTMFDPAMLMVSGMVLFHVLTGIA